MTIPNAPLRIVHYVPAVRLEQGGVVRSILDWCTVFAQRGHQMSLVVYQSKDLPRDWLESQPGKPRAYLIPEPTPPLKLLGRPAMRLMDDLLQNADVLHLHGPWLDGNRQIANLARRRGIPYLVSTHGMLDDWSMAQRSFKKRLYLSMFGRRLLNKRRRNPLHRRGGAVPSRQVVQQSAHDDSALPGRPVPLPAIARPRVRPAATSCCRSRPAQTAFSKPFA